MPLKLKETNISDLENNPEKARALIG